MNHKRYRGRSLEQRVWHYLRTENKPCRPCKIAKTMEISQASMRNTMLRLLRKGCVIAEGHTHQRFYQATNVKPEDMRGTAIATLETLQYHSLARVNPDRHKHHPRVTLTTELERHWK